MGDDPPTFQLSIIVIRTFAQRLGDSDSMSSCARGFQSTSLTFQKSILTTRQGQQHPPLLLLKLAQTQKARRIARKRGSDSVSK